MIPSSVEIKSWKSSKTSKHLPPPRHRDLSKRMRTMNNHFHGRDAFHSVPNIESWPFGTLWKASLPGFVAYRPMILSRHDSVISRLLSVVSVSSCKIRVHQCPSVVAF